MMAQPEVGRENGLLARFGRLMRTTAFKLASVYLLLFIAFAIGVLGYLAWSTQRLLDRQITENIESEINSLAEQYRQGGIRRLITVMERRGRQSGSFIYLLVDLRGDSVTGNAILRVPALDQRPGWTDAAFNWPDESSEMLRQAKIRVFVLPTGFRLFVGRDLEEKVRLQEAIRRARGWSLLMVVLLGGFTAWFVTRRVLSRVDAIAASSRAIMDGNLAERLPVTNTNDEFDRLSMHLNQMLDRIGDLMTGLRQLSDNVAHDLRTPLTRLRNGVEEALRKATTMEESRTALEKAIDESDGLIRIFDALLMIARAESGNLATSLKPKQADDLIRSIGELYEAAAEESGVVLSVQATSGATISANRDLLGRAISNLIDNALKYGRDADGKGAIRIASEMTGKRVRLVVADRGRGIAEADRQRVTERFVRLDESRGQSGFGLGLSLVAAIAHLHGGELTLEDNAPGLRAVIDLPVAEPAEIAQKSSA